MTNAKFHPVKANDVEFTFTMTMPLHRWRKVRDVLQGHEWPLKEALDELIRAADTVWSWECPDKDSQPS